MEDYRLKLENLPLNRLENLIQKYRETIGALEAKRRDARIAAMMGVVEYMDQELNKKKGELEKIELIIANKKSNREK